MPDEENIADIAYVECMRNIKEYVKEYLCKQEIILEVRKAIAHGVKSFCEEYYQDIIQEITKSALESISLDMNMKIKDGEISLKK